jgi:hypothetical protein
MSIQIPNLHTSNRSKVTADGATVLIKRRQDATHSGQFSVSGSLSFNPATDAYPTGSLVIKVDLNDSVKGTIRTSRSRSVQPLSPSWVVQKATLNGRRRRLLYFVLLLPHVFSIQEDKSDC